MNEVLPPFSAQVKMFLTNPVFLAAVTSWLSAQFLKTAIKLILGKIHSLKQLLEMMLWTTGGMPSSHSAMTTSVCVTLGFKCGINSNLFIFSLMFFFVVIRDSFGVRRSSGIQANKINQIGEELKEKEVIKEFKKMKVVNGHTPMEVVCGCLLGILIGLSYSLLY
ncbi:MAG: divergent PAP2 family protein [Treponema sp.]|nr:divergent PAP2 family protein [Treponema sp.]